MSTSWLRLTPELTAEQGQEAQTESAGTRIARRGSLRERLRGDETPRPGQPSDEVRSGLCDLARHGRPPSVKGSPGPVFA